MLQDAHTVREMVIPACFCTETALHAGQCIVYLLECRTIARPMELIQSSLSCIHEGAKLHDITAVQGRLTLPMSI